MRISRTRHLAWAAIVAVLAGCAATQQAMKPPTTIEGRYVKIELQDGQSYPVEKVDRLYERVAALLGVTLHSGDTRVAALPGATINLYPGYGRPTIVFTTPEVIRERYQANGAGELLNGSTPLAGYVDGKVLTWGYDASRLARMLTYHVAFQYLKVDQSEAERLAMRIENRITWETMNPFNNF